MTTKNNTRYQFADYDEHRKSSIPRLIWKDHHTSWDRTYYDFGHYGGKSLESHHNYKARYSMKKRNQIIHKIIKYLKEYSEKTGNCGKLQSVKLFSDCIHVETRGYTDANAIATIQKITNGKIIYYNWIKNNKYLVTHYKINQ